MDQLLNLNMQGLVPGPDEGTEEFLERANYCLILRERIKEELGEALPFKPEFEQAPTGLTTEQSYGIKPEWVPIFYSNDQLPFWQGGCTWIFQMTETSPRAALLQLRKSFRESTSYLFGLYHRDEFLTHEMCHIGRMAFDEPKFEEVLAYRSSASPFRRYFGPIVESPKESMVFVLLCLMVFLVDISLFSMGYYDMVEAAIWTKLIPLGLIGFALIRLCKKQKTFAQAESKLRKLLNTNEDVNAVLYRLTDDEIITFSRLSVDEIKTYILNQTQHSLRWQVIQDAYLK